MAYNSAQRFPSPPKYYRFFDPGAYQYTQSEKVKPNKVPFLSKCPRNIQSASKIWTHAIYNTDLPPKIQNCTSIQSKLPRFPYESLSEEDIIEQTLCRCGIKDTCECAVEGDLDNKDDILCQATVRRRLFKGLPPRCLSDEGLSAPSKTDRGFKLLQDGSQKRVFKEIHNDPIFYDVSVAEASAFYRGCKWSRWTSQRTQKIMDDRPGPADYFIERKPEFFEVCAEKVRAKKRRTSKQLRYIEMVQWQNILENRPGPATYSPMIPKGAVIQFMGSKAKRFPISKYNIGPGPADHYIKRDFDLLDLPENRCHAKLPTKAPFGFKAIRLKHLREEGPSPANYNAIYKPCQMMRCSSAPFGSSSKRFTATIVEEDSDDEIIKELTQNADESKLHVCWPLKSWPFKSKTIRMKPLVKKYNEPSPADFPQPKLNTYRSPVMQYSSPFFSSEKRFMPWYNSIAVHGKEKTPGPAYYCLEKFKCQPAVFRGPLYREQRFKSADLGTPPPNQYTVGGGIENILTTHNQNLKNNIANQHKFYWNPVIESRKLSIEDQESKLLDKCIELLDTTDVHGDKSSEIATEKSSKDQLKSATPKMLRCFMYTKQIKPYF